RPLAAVAVLDDVGEHFLDRQAHGEAHFAVGTESVAGGVDEGCERGQVGHGHRTEAAHADRGRGLHASASIFATRRWMSTGLVSKSSQPAAIALSRSSAMACAVTAVIGIAPVRWSAVIRRVASQPSLTGRPTALR